MKNQINMANGLLKPLTKETVELIAQWEYETPCNGCSFKDRFGRILLRVSARNKKAIRAYKKAGFRYAETIQDEIAFSDDMEDFRVMALPSPITVREAASETDAAVFWERLHACYKRDIFSDSDIDELEYFLGSEYHDHCASELGERTRALYAELNYGSNARRRHFWETASFMESGADEWDEPLMILPPEENAPITIEILSDPEDRQLKKLENGFLKEIGETPSTEEKQEKLAQAIRDGKITFFMAKRGYRAVGMCSIAKCFSTFACADTGIFDDFYIEPAFRRKGVARMLAQAAQQWAKDNGIASLTVTCAPCDEKMYQPLGFDTHLGRTFAYLC